MHHCFLFSSHEGFFFNKLQWIKLICLRFCISLELSTTKDPTIKMATEERGGWTVVASRRSKWVTFFFRNFQEKCSATELRRHFETVGKVGDLFIPAKRDKLGKRFGFVRFRSSGDEEKLLQKVNNIWVGTYIIRAYKPLFDRTKENNKGVGRRSADKESCEGGSREIRCEGTKAGGVSFLEVVKGTRGETAKEGRVQRAVEVGSEMCHFLSEDEDGERLKDAFIGCLKSEFRWKVHENEMLEESAGRLKLTDMGNNLVLIQGTKEMKMEEELKGWDEWCDYWLEWARPWKCTDVNQSRLVWTRWINVPLQAWMERFFNIGCSSFGSLIGLHAMTEKKLRLDEAFVKVNTGLNTIDRIISCNIDGVTFKIRVEEL